MLPDTMNAVVAYQKGNYKYETNVPTPQPKGAQIIMKVEACGICAGDIKAFQGGARFWGGDGFDAFVKPPFIPGHEFLGHVAAFGPNYSGPFVIGQRIISEQIVPCGQCRYCREERHWLCDPHDVYGFKDYLPGGFAQYVCLPETALNYPVPEDMLLEQALLIEPFACSLHAVERAAIQPGDVVVIAGAGPLGQGMITEASHKGARAVVSIEPIAKRREQAARQGATHTMDVWTGQGVHPLIAELTEGYGCDVYIEATGDPSGVSQGLQLIRKGGRFVEFSVMSGPSTIDFSIIGDAKEIDMLGSSLSPFCYPRAIEGIASGYLKTDGVLTHQFPLSDFQRAFEVCARHEGIKVALIP